MNTKRKKLMKKSFISLLFLFLYSMIFFIIALLIGVLISNHYNYKLQDVMTYEAIIIIIIALFTLMKGNPSETEFNRIGDDNAQLLSYWNLEVTRSEREIHPYYKDLFKNNFFHFSYKRISLIFTGLMILVTFHLTKLL